MNRLRTRLRASIADGPLVLLDFLSGGLDSRITFSRGTTATFVGSNGLIQTAAINAPRFDYDPVTLAAKGLLIEEARTNLALYSQQFDDANWGKQNATISANSTVAPDGTSTADKLIEDATNNFHRAFQVPTLTAVAHTITVYAKPAGRNWLYMANASLSQAAYFNVSTGVVGTIVGATTATITPVGNGWYRCSITSTPSAGAQNYSFYTASADGSFSYTGDGTSGLFLWGAQLEAGAFATSYTPTVASTVTRSADVATMTGTNFSSWFNATEGTFTFNGDSAYGSGGFIGSTPTTGAILYANTNTSRTFNGTNFVGTANTYTTNTAFSTALGYSAAGRAIVLNGATVATDANLIQTPTAITLGGAFGGGFLNGHIRSIAYYNTRLLNSQLQTLTAPSLGTTLSLSFTNQAYTVGV